MIWLYAAAYLTFGLGTTLALSSDSRKFPRMVMALTWPVYICLLVIGIAIAIYEHWYANR